MSSEPQALTYSSIGVKELPPLILHPFAGSGDPAKLMESSRAGMTLEGMLPDGGANRENLDRVLIEGRYCEMRMLFHVGKDLTRWIGQCLEVAARDPEAFPPGVNRQSFIDYLIRGAPKAVQEKLRLWGVRGFQRIFSRAIALNYVFVKAPDQDMLAEDFIRYYHRFADQMFSHDQRQQFASLDPPRYSFELYASGEYSRMLERQWEE